MTRRALLIWVGLAAFLTLVGFLRPLAFEPGLGMFGAQLVAAGLSLVAITIAAWVFSRATPPPAAADYRRAGILWAGLTLALEILGGLILADIPPGYMLANYNLLAGRLWLVVLAALLLIPIAFGRSALARR